MTRRRLLLVVLAAAALAGVLLVLSRREAPLPADIRTEETLRDISGTSSSDGALRAGWLHPSPSLRAEGGQRRALLASPAVSCACLLS